MSYKYYLGFGGCPICGFGEEYRNIEKCHWFICPAHKTKWCVGRTLMSSWQFEAEADWAANAEYLVEFTEVEPIGDLRQCAEWQAQHRRAALLFRLWCAWRWIRHELLSRFQRPATRRIPAPPFWISLIMDKLTPDRPLDQILSAMMTAHRDFTTGRAQAPVLPPISQFLCRLRTVFPRLAAARDHHHADRQTRNRNDPNRRRISMTDDNCHLMNISALSLDERIALAAAVDEMRGQPREAIERTIHQSFPLLHVFTGGNPLGVDSRMWDRIMEQILDAEEGNYERYHN